MNGHGYSPQGRRPEPTTAPATPSPLSPPERDATTAVSGRLSTPAALRAEADRLERQAKITAAAADGPERLRERIERAVAFIAARLEDPYTEYETRLHRSLGWAYGYAEACLDHGDLEGAAKELLGLHSQAADWHKHTDYLQAIR
ncbi:hypothetical protein ACFVHW_04100 [Streptomyces sp. NPDC127110]|uniref:hypothetical protein n=1 Tax=Streptomyces sp. NPDC127110 TaxID=3345362 RepID=UPI003631EE08